MRPYCAQRTINFLERRLFDVWKRQPSPTIRLQPQELSESRMDFWFFNLFTGLSWIISYKVREFPIFLNSSSSTTVFSRTFANSLSTWSCLPLCLSCFKRFCKMTRYVLECFPHSWQFLFMQDTTSIGLSMIVVADHKRIWICCGSIRQILSHLRGMYSHLVQIWTKMQAFLEKKTKPDLNQKLIKTFVKKKTVPVNMRV